MIQSVLSSIFTRTPEGEIVGVVSEAFTPDGGTVLQHPLVGTSNNVSKMTGQLSTNIRLAGSAVMVVTSYSTFGVAVPLTGGMVVQSVTTGAITTAQPARGDMVVNSTMTGELKNRPPKIQTVPTIQFEQGTASEYDLSDLVSDSDLDELVLKFSTPPAGLPTAFSFDPLTGILSYDGSDFGLSGDDSRVWEGNRLIASDGIELDSFARSDVLMTGDLNAKTFLFGGMSCKTTMTGLLTIPADLVGQILGSVTMEGALVAPIEFQGVVSGSCTMSGTLSNVVPLRGDIVNNVMMTGALYAQITEIAGQVINSVEMSGTLISQVLFEGEMLINVSGLGRLGPDYIFEGAQINSVDMVGKLTTIDKTSPWEQEPLVGTEWTKEAPL